VADMNFQQRSCNWR